MADILIRGVPDEVVAAIDDRARRAGLSRAEYLRRALVREGGPVGGKVDVGDLLAFAETFGDLDDPEVMASAWR